MKMDGTTLALLAVGGLAIYYVWQQRQTVPARMLPTKPPPAPQILTVARSWTDRAMEAGYF